MVLPLDASGLCIRTTSPSPRAHEARCPMVLRPSQALIDACCDHLGGGSAPRARPPHTAAPLEGARERLPPLHKSERATWKQRPLPRGPSVHRPFTDSLTDSLTDHFTLHPAPATFASASSTQKSRDARTTYASERRRATAARRPRGHNVHVATTSTWPQRPRGHNVHVAISSTWALHPRGHTSTWARRPRGHNFQSHERTAEWAQCARRLCPRNGRSALPSATIIGGHAASSPRMIA